MTGDKLIGRMEQVVWEPPLLSFRIERHGGMVRGSSRAEIQAWAVDVETGTASGGEVGYRQSKPRAPRLDVRLLAERVDSLIVAGDDDPCLSWSPDRARVRVLVGHVIPAAGSLKRTLQGRRKRFWQALDHRLQAAGWERISRDAYVRGAVA